MSAGVLEVLQVDGDVVVLCSLREGKRNESQNSVYVSTPPDDRECEVGVRCHLECHSEREAHVCDP